MSKTTPNTTTTPTDDAIRVTSAITVLGLGDMGSAIARTFVEHGHRTTVWNRTASKTDPLVEIGASAAATAADAVAASPLVVICVLDTTALDEVLDSIGEAVAGKVLVNLTSGPPAHARATEQWAHDRGAQYLDGKVMGDPPDVGSDRILLPFSGSLRAFRAHEATLRELGTIDHRGEDAGAAAVEFMAQVAVSYELLIGVLHTLRLVEAEGFDVTEFAERVAGTVGALSGLLPSMAKVIASGEYGPDLGSLDVQAALMSDLIGHRESVGVESVRMREVKDLMDRRIADGHGGHGFSSLFELVPPSEEAAETNDEPLQQLVRRAQESQSDVEPFLSLHTDDAVIVNVGGRRVLGVDELRTAMESALASPLAAVTTTAEIHDVRYLRPDVALISATKHVVDDRPDGGDLAAHGALTYVAVREDGTWRIALAQTTPVATG